MAQAPKRNRRKPAADKKPDAAPVADAPKPGDDDSYAQDQAQAAADKAAEKEAKEKAEAERQEKLATFKGKLGDTLEDLQTRDKSDAIALRELGVKVGQCLIEGKNLFRNEDSNAINNVAYGKWLSENFGNSLGSRPTINAYEWLAQVHDLNPDLYAMFPTDPEGDEPVMRTPRSMRNWFDKQIADGFQMCFEDNADMAVPDPEQPIKERQEAAKDQIGNVVSDLQEISQHFREAADKAFDAMKGKSGKALDVAQKDHAEAEAKAAVAERRHALLTNISTEEAAQHFAKWKPTVAATKFENMTIEQAAAALFVTLKKHDEMIEVVDALRGIVKDHMDKVAADDGDVDDDDDSDDDSDDDIDVDDDDIDVDDDDIDVDDLSDDDLDDLDGFDDDDDEPV